MQTETVPGTSYQEIPIDMLRESLWNPRKHYNEHTLEELAASIREKGVIEPIVVRALTKRDSKRDVFEIVAGSRRFRASKLAGRPTVPAVVRQLEDVAALELAVIENQQRDDVHPLDEAEGYQALLKADKAYTPAVVAAKVGKSESYVYRRLKLLGLYPDAKRAFEADRMTVAHAERLARLSHDLQKQAFESQLYHPFFMYREEDDATPKAERLPNRDALRPIAELDAFIRKHSAINPHGADTPHYFPEIAGATQPRLSESADEAGDVDEDTGPDTPSARLLELSEHHFVRNELGLAKNAPAPLSVNKWHAIKSEKDRCAHVERGAVVHGGTPRVLEVCATKGCPKHFPTKKRSKAASKKAAAAAQQDTWKREQEERRARQEAWEALKPHALKALAEHVAGMKLKLVDVVKFMFTGHQITSIHKVYGVTLTESTALQVLVLGQVGTPWNRDEFLREVKPLGFNLGHVEQRLKAQQKKAAKVEQAKKGGRK